MNSQNIPNLNQKPAKNKIWIIATIWANIVIVGLILVVILQFLNVFLHQFFITIIGQALLWLIGIFVFVYAIRLGIKSVLKKTVIIKEDVIKISVGVVMVAVIFQLVFIVLGLIFLEIGPTLNRYLEFIGADILYFIITYFWCKKLIK